MRTYKFYPVDEEGHIVHAPHIIEAKNYPLALEKARQFLDGHDLDIWEGERRLGLLKREASK